ncbi:GGDEF domain-containing protein [Blastococcus xanthinilyticus]|uniref:Diguanylate cyclase (GGDEF)-like protein n=1 Tax=Blastococcus xanthinilyticus TaxID=1564164 RepID=A0A5S5D323_9ACTN|nr:GGDEF domain-containing protein [Blastococcus xanthinilyticus]TYP90437.1 diguanylate cyclase (GGDEF)-like protein [Blastococcus xanthinilyticus]
MHRRARLFLGVLAVVGAGSVAVELARSLPGLTDAPAVWLVVTAAVALLLFSPVTVGRRDRANHMTFGETAAVLAFAALPPAAAALSCGAAATVLVLSLRTRAENRLFNAASTFTAAAAGALTAAALQAAQVPTLVAAAAAAVVLGTLSHLQVVTVLSLDRGRLIEGLGTGLRQLAVVEAAGVALGLVLAPVLLRDPAGAWRLLPLLLVLAVLSRRHSRLGSERDLLDALAEATADLHSSLRQDQVLDALHAHAARLLPGSEVALQADPPLPSQVGEAVEDGALWLVARSGAGQVGVPAEQRVLSGLAAAARRALDNARLHRTVEEQARTDALTGLPNRGALLRHLDRELARTRRHGGHLALAFLDLDGFKRVNDLHGHEAGDAVLVELAARLRGEVRAEDLVARLAGDEFCVVLADVTDRAQAGTLAEELRGRLDTELGARGIGVSIGVALAPDDGADTDALLHAADLAMYADKAARCSPGGPRSLRDGMPAEER